MASALQNLPGTCLTDQEQQALVEGAGSQLAKVMIAAANQEGDVIEVRSPVPLESCACGVLPPSMV